MLSGQDVVDNLASNALQSTAENVGLIPAASYRQVQVGRGPARTSKAVYSTPSTAH